MGRKNVVHLSLVNLTSLAVSRMLAIYPLPMMLIRKKAWMTSEFFRQQISMLDSKMGAQNRKILLFVDHCPAHPIDLHLRNVQLVFLPANCTSKATTGSGGHSLF